MICRNWNERIYKMRAISFIISLVIVVLAGGGCASLSSRPITESKPRLTESPEKTAAALEPDKVLIKAAGNRAKELGCTLGVLFMRQPNKQQYKGSACCHSPDIFAPDNLLVANVGSLPVSTGAMPLKIAPPRDDVYYVPNAEIDIGTKARPSRKSGLILQPGECAVLKHGHFSKLERDLTADEAKELVLPGELLMPPGLKSYVGMNRVRIQNPSDRSVLVGLRTPKCGENLNIPANEIRSFFMPNGTCKIYFVFSDMPGKLFQGADFRLAGNAIEITLTRVADGNYTIKQIK